MCVCVCPLQAIPQSTIDFIIITLGMVNAPDMRMHHVLIILTLTFIQGQADHNHENNICLIISESFQAMPIKFAVKLVYIIFASSMTLTFTQDHNCVLTLTIFDL